MNLSETCFGCKKRTEKKMKGELSHDLEVGVTASEVWDIYGGLKLGMMLNKLIPNVIQNVEVIEGDGGVGTILKVTFQPGGQVTYHKEKFVEIDNEKRIKVVEVIEGGYLDLGFRLFHIRLEIIKKDAESSSIIKTILEYEVEDKYAANASFVTNEVLIAIAEAVKNYLTSENGNATV